MRRKISPFRAALYFSRSLGICDGPEQDQEAKLDPERVIEHWIFPLRKVVLLINKSGMSHISLSDIGFSLPRKLLTPTQQRLYGLLQPRRQALGPTP